MALKSVGYAGINLYHELEKQLKNKKLLNLVQIDRKQTVMDVNYNASVKESELQKIIDKLTKIYGQITPEVGKGRLKTKGNSVTFGNPSPRLGIFRINFNLKKESGDRIKTPIQEKGTTIVFQRALNENKKFNSASDILNDKKTREKLDECFKGYEDKLDDWVHTYYEQQKVFLKKFEGVKWSEFKYGNDDFVKFFETQIKNVARSVDPTVVPLKKYTEWNPSDIWAAYDMPKLKDEIEKTISKDKWGSLGELNSFLTRKFREKKLIGISLKLIGPKKQAKLVFRNDTEDNYKIAEVDNYEVGKDIKFDLDNIWEKSDVGAATVYAHYGNSFGINFTRAGNQIAFSTQVKHTSAQGGNTPVEMVEKLLKDLVSNNNYSNHFRDYPLTYDHFLELPEQKFQSYEKMYNLVKPHFKSNAPSFGKFAEINGVLHKTYKNDERNGRLKLMFLSFFSNAFKIKKDDQKEFWTDMLYMGMKIGKKGQFAPHAKIGEKTS